MPKGINNMENKYEKRFIIMKYAIESNKQEMKSNKQDSDEKMTQFTVKSETMLAVISNHIITLIYSPTRRIHQLLLNLPPWLQLTGGFHHWKEETLQKLVACGTSNMRSSHQNYMSSSSRQNLTETLLWISRTSTTTSRFASMRCL